MERRVTVADVSCILSFLFIIYFSFFGTGNIASVNSFDPSTIRCFVARSNPPLMAALLLLKILLPYLAQMSTKFRERFHYNIPSLHSINDMS